MSPVQPKRASLRVPSSRLTPAITTRTRTAVPTRIPVRSVTPAKRGRPPTRVSRPIVSENQVVTVTNRPVASNTSENLVPVGNTDPSDQVGNENSVGNQSLTTNVDLISREESVLHNLENVQPVSTSGSGPKENPVASNSTPTISSVATMATPQNVSGQDTVTPNDFSAVPNSLLANPFQALNASNVLGLGSVMQFAEHSQNQEMPNPPTPATNLQPTGLVQVNAAPTTSPTQSFASSFPFPPQGTTTNAVMPALSFNDWLSLIRAFQSPAPPMPEYSGRNHEDPQKFLNDCERHFSQARMDPGIWTQMVEKGLKGQAQTWWASFRGLSFSWEKFKEQLLAKFNSVTAIMQLQATLYSRRQGEKEAVAVFLQEQYLLAQRLCPTMTDVQVTTLLLEAIKPTLRRLIRARNPVTFATLLDYATQAERDEADCAPRKETSKKEDAKSQPIQEAGQRQSNERSLPPCRFCPDRHLHKDCPVLAAYHRDHPRQSQQQSGNWRDRASGAETSDARVPPAPQS